MSLSERHFEIAFIKPTLFKLLWTPKVIHLKTVSYSKLSLNALSSVITRVVPSFSWIVAIGSSLFTLLIEQLFKLINT